MTAPLTIRVYYDFASSVCHVAHRVMQRMGGDLDALEIELDWKPVDLSLLLGWPRDMPIAGPRRDNALRVARELGVPVRIPTRWLDSRPAAARALELAGTPAEVAWRERVFSAIHEEGREIDSPSTLASLAGELGMDWNEGGDAVDESRFDDLVRMTEGARRCEVAGVPTFMFDRWPFSGIQHEGVMRSFFARFAEKTRQEAAS